MTGSPGANAAPPAQGEGAVSEVVVTGFRASLRSSIEAKRNEVGVVDVIKAEDIAALPDNNLAEAIQRIPGVSIDRDGGEGRSITVRGLSPDFTRVLVNGIEAQATTGGSDASGGVNRGRQFDFNVFASELFQSITVRKTQSADVEEGSLGATVELQATRPFDLKRGPNLAISAQGAYNDLNEKGGPRLALLASDTWLDGRFGALVSVAYQERFIREEGYNSTRWDNGLSSTISTAGVAGTTPFCSPLGVTPSTPANSSTTGASAALCATGVPRTPQTPQNLAAYQLVNSTGTYLPRLPALNRIDYDNTRTGVTASFQYRPTPKTLLNLDLLYANYKSRRQEYSLGAISFSRSATQGGKTQTTVLDGVRTDDGDLVYGLFNGVDFRTSARFDKLDTDFFQYTVSGSHAFSDRFRVDFLAGRAGSLFDNPVQTTVTLDNRNLNGFAYDYRVGDGRIPQLTFPYNVNDPAQYQLLGFAANTNYSEIRIRPQSAKNTLSTARLNFAYDVTDEFTVRGGYGYKRYSFLTSAVRRSNQDESILAPPAGTDIGQLSQRLTGFGSGLGAPTPSSFLVPDLNKIAALYNIYCNCLQSGAVAGPGDFTLTGVSNGNARQQNQEVGKSDNSSYIEGAIKTRRLFDRLLRADFGRCYVRTHTRSIGYQATGGGTLVNISNDYDDLLPSLNIAYNLRNDFVLRFGLAQVMARSTLATLQAGGSFSTSAQTATGAAGTVTIGNPFLQPYRADTIDFSAEWYFAPEALLSFAYFHKDVNTYVQQLRTQLPFNQTGLSNTLLPGSFTGNELFDVTTFVNTQGGPLDGIEVSYQQPFNWGFVPNVLRGFGTQVNFTHVVSSIDYVTSTINATLINADLIGLSNNAYNATVYYERGPFRGRVVASYRDGYLQVVPGRNNNDVEGKNSTFNLDLSASWNLTKQLSLTFDALNLTDQFNDQYNDSRRCTCTRAGSTTSVRGTSSEPSVIAVHHRPGLAPDALAAQRGEGGAPQRHLRVADDQGRGPRQPYAVQPQASHRALGQAVDAAQPPHPALVRHVLQHDVVDVGGERPGRLRRVGPVGRDARVVGGHQHRVAHVLQPHVTVGDAADLAAASAGRLDAQAGVGALDAHVLHADVAHPAVGLAADGQAVAVAQHAVADVEVARGRAGVRGVDAAGLDGDLVVAHVDVHAADHEAAAGGVDPVRVRGVARGADGHVLHHHVLAGVGHQVEGGRVAQRQARDAQAPHPVHQHQAGAGRLDPPGLLLARPGPPGLARAVDHAAAGERHVLRIARGQEGAHALAVAEARHVAHGLEHGARRHLQRRAAAHLERAGQVGPAREPHPPAAAAVQRLLQRGGVVGAPVGPGAERLRRAGGPVGGGGARACGPGRQQQGEQKSAVGHGAMCVRIPGQVQPRGRRPDPCARGERC